MKSPETNPLAAAGQVTPAPIALPSDDDRGGGSGQVPIAISDGDFSTPTRRKRTITRPRGVRTLEQLATVPHVIPGVEILNVVIGDAAVIESPTAATSDTQGHEASVVDEFLAAPPTPAPEVDGTPPPEPPAVPSPDARQFSGLDTDMIDNIDNVDAATDLRRAALVDQGLEEDRARDQAGHQAGHQARDQGRDPEPDSEGGADKSFSPEPEQNVVDNLLQEAAAHLLASVDGDDVSSELAASVEAVRADTHLEPRLEVSITLALEQPVAQPDLPEVTPRADSLFDANVAADDITKDVPLSPREGVGPPPVTAESGLSPLAQTLAHMAEAMQMDLTIDTEVDVEIVDGPLVPMQAGALTPARSVTPPPRPVPPTFPVDVAPRLIPAAPFAGLPEALAERPRRPKRSKPWFEEVFDESYLRTLPFMTADQTLREVDFIESSLALPRGGEVLDVGCGYGRHAIELVQRGLAVTGLDLSLPLLIRAADESQRRAVSVNFVHTDMREMAFERQFAGAYSMLTSFGYFDEESNLKVAEGIARALKPGGRFLLDVVNRDYIVGDLPARVWWEGDGCVVLEEVEFNFNTNRILTHRSVVFEDGQQLEQEISIRVYSLHEMGKLLRQAGFRVIEVSGSIPTRGHFFGANSRNLLILAERRSD